jgi:nucleoside-diphosphate-sugar epimerase
MKVAVTGATGFLGRYIVDRLAADGNQCRCWYRNQESCFQPPGSQSVEWIHGELGDSSACAALVADCDAVVHSGLHRTGRSFRGGEGDIAEFVQTNVVGSIQLIEAARTADVPRFVFVSTCAVHEKILDDRPLDEHHPLYPLTHYGAYKAAVEQFVHSYGFGAGYNICAIRPSGIYGVHHQPGMSKWFDLVQRVRNGEPVVCERGGKEVHVADVAAAINLLLHNQSNAGEVFSCCDRYISEYQVASLAKELTGSRSEISGGPKSPRHTIICDKLRSLGFQFGGQQRLTETVTGLLEALQRS